MKIQWTRDSVCMADDVEAPNAKVEEVNHPLTAAELLDLAADYVPGMSGAIWVVWVEGLLAGFLEMSTSGYLLRDEPVLSGTLLLNPRLQSAALHVHCVHYGMSDFFCRKGQDGRPLIEQFPPYTSLLDMVKAQLWGQAGYGENTP